MGEINKRMFAIMKSKQKKAINLARVLDLPPNTISAWRTRGTDPKAHQMKPIADFLGISQHYLETGEEDSPENEANIYVNKIFDSPELKTLIDALDDFKKEDIELMVQFAKRMKRNESK